MSDTNETRRKLVASIMEATAVSLAQPLMLYTGTPDLEFYNIMTGFNGRTQKKFDETFMQHNQRQGQAAQMGAGVYATPSQAAARGYGGHLVSVRVSPGALFLNLSDTTVTGRLRNLGVKPDEWADANPRAVVRFNGDYHVIKTVDIDFQPM
jgi:hypothetical protein